MTRIDCAAATHVGRIRENNQDRALVSGQLAAVADGMGGHAGGDRAAALAIAELGGVRGTISAERLIKVVQAANKRIFTVALAPELRGMGTTIVAAVVDDETGVLSLINVGDSRGYQLRDGVLRQVTDDHSLVEDLVRSGRLTEDEAKVHPQRNIVTRVLGIGEDVDVDLFQIDVRSGDRYLLCSDGLTNEVDDEGIASILQSHPTSSSAADQLVRVAVDSGGRDNVTVAIIDVLEGPDRSPTRTQEIATVPHGAEEELAPTDLNTLVTAIGAGPESTGPAGWKKEPSDNAPLDEAQDGPLKDDSEDGPPPPPTTAAPAEEPNKKSARSRWFLPLRPFLLGVSALGLTLVATMSSSWYASSAWYAADVDGEVVILQGRPGGFLWHDPAPVEVTGVRVEELNGTAHELLTSEPSWSSLSEAKGFVDNLQAKDGVQVTGS